jgi:dicarboxylate transporter 10
MIGGCCGSLVACPTDMMLVRMQADGRLPEHQQRRYRNVIHGLYRVAREEGILAWYRGLGPLVVRGVLVTTAQFSTYDQAKEMFVNRFGFSDSMPIHFASSAIAGVVAATVSTPCDVIKSRMMNSTKAGQHGNPSIVYRSSWQCLVMTLRAEGMPGMFKGFVPCLARMMPQVILLWNFYELYKIMWTKQFG